MRVYETTDRPALNQITQGQQDKLFSEKWSIPGQGEQQPYCGDEDWITLKCSSGAAGHDHMKLKHSCKRLHCPICWDERAWTEAYKATERLDGISQAWRGQGGRDLLWPVKVMLSPPRDQLTTRPMEELRQEARKLLHELGGIGGLIVWHPFRGSPERIEQIRKREVAPRPGGHFHNVVFMPSKPDDRLFEADQVRELHERTGWVIKIYSRTIKAGPMAGQYYGVAKHVHYELTHCGIDNERQNAHTLTWWGVCAYNNVHVDEVKVEEPHVCSVCGAPVNQYRTTTYIKVVGRHRDFVEKSRADPVKPVYNMYIDELVMPEVIEQTIEQDLGQHMKKRVERYYSLRLEQVGRQKIKYGLLLGTEVSTTVSSCAHCSSQ